ncbi:MAG: MarC family protein [Planctomycetota bacterium]
MINELLPFLSILNPFALCLYLSDTAHELGLRAYVRTIGVASLISYATFLVFALGGRPLLVKTLHIQPEAMRLFGGIIFLVIAHDYVMKGYRATAELRGRLHLPSAVALPYMIGAGTITQSILIGEHLTLSATILTLFFGVVTAFVVLLLFKIAGDQLKKRREDIMNRYLDLFARLNALVIGAISTQMIMSGVRTLWEHYG